jgi:ribosomal protein L4
VVVVDELDNFRTEDPPDGAGVEQTWSVIHRLVFMPKRPIMTPSCAARQHRDAKVLLAGYLNMRDLFNYDKLVLPVKTLDALTAHLG